MKLFGVNQISNAYFSENDMSRKLRKNMKETNKPLSQEEFESLHKSFISDSNVDNLNSMVKNKILEDLNVNISLQERTEIKLAAQYMWNNSVVYISKNRILELEILNNLFIEKVMPEMKTKILQKIKYLKDIDYSNREINNLPENTRSNNHLLSMVDKLSFKEFKFNY